MFLLMPTMHGFCVATLDAWHLGHLPLLSDTLTTLVPLGFSAAVAGGWVGGGEGGALYWTALLHVMPTCDSTGSFRPRVSPPHVILN